MTNIADIVSFDTSSIIFTRHTKVNHAGGYSWALTTLPAQTGRIYWYSTRNMHEVTINEGEVKKVVLGVLFDGITANVRCDHDCYDTFQMTSTDSPPTTRTFRIVGVRRYDDANIDANAQCDAVAV